MNSKSNKKDTICMLKDVCKSFTNKVILHQLNFSFLCGKNYLIKGESGIGKTTLLNILANLETIDAGSVEYNSETKVEYMFQNVLLFPPLTVQDNLFLKIAGYYDTVSPQTSEEFPLILEKVGLAPSTLTQKISFLSGGERKRLQLAQIMLTQPHLILLDEPTANLDYERKHDILNLIDTTFAKATKIVVSHDFEHYSGRDYVLLELRKGKLNYV